MLVKVIWVARDSNLLEKKGEMYWLINPQEDGMGLAGGLLASSPHSLSDQLFHKAGVPSATSHGFISFTALEREKRGPLHSAPFEITQRRTLKGLT